MYFPYLRGKQYELILVRENAGLLAKSDFTPIIEPVKESLAPLERSLKAICEAGGQAIVIVNPGYGEHSSTGHDISSLLKRGFLSKRGVSAGILLKKGMALADAVRLVNEHKDHSPTLIHAGFNDAKGLINALGASIEEMRHVFLDSDCGKLYWGHFKTSKRILIKDGFQKRKRNKDHPELEFFSDLHITFPDDGMDGFGDFLTVGDDFSESGGPAYAIAIHLSFLWDQQDDAMYIHHFKSHRQDTPTDPAGKFAEALGEMIKALDEGDSSILESNAVKQFRRLYDEDHFPGLGTVKKLSMQHHLETLADFLS